MAHEEHPLCLLGKKLLQPLDRLDIKMVGGLVKEEQVAVPEQNLGQLYTHAPTTGKLVGGTVEILAPEAETYESTLRFGVHIAHILYGDALMKIFEAVEKLLILPALIVYGLGEAAVDFLKLGLAAVNLGKGLLHLFEQSSLVGQLHLLREITDYDVGRHRYGTGRRGLESGQYFEEGGLPGAVLAHECHFVSLIDDKTDIAEERLGRKLNPQSVDRNHTAKLAKIPQTAQAGARHNKTMHRETDPKHSPCIKIC